MNLNVNKIALNLSRLPMLEKNEHWNRALLKYQEHRTFMEADAFPSHSSSEYNYLQIKYDFHLKNWTIFRQFTFFHSGQFSNTQGAT